MSAFKYQWNQTIDVGTACLLSKQWTSIRHILSLLVTANACVHVTAYVAVLRSLSTTYTAVVPGLLLRQYVSYQFGVWAGIYASVNWANFGSGNGLSPTQHQAITWTNVDLLSIGLLGAGFSEIQIQIRNFSFMKMHLKMSSVKWRPFCPVLS